ncbi:MAG TPA: hypothetical protein VL992_21445, partial [Tepidisphaeraceae bacterium]|nr:hypothetical protein [Tepidisphaeraceae bacterium]
IRVPGPRITAAYFYLAPYFLKRGSPELAESLADEGIKYSDNDREKAILLTWRAIGVLQTTGDTTKAREDFLEAMRIGSDVPIVAENYGVFREVEERVRSESQAPAESENEWSISDDPDGLLQKSSRIQSMFSTDDQGLQSSRKFAGAM